MNQEIKIKPDQIKYIDKHGIHFINDAGESDFLSFAISHECLLHFATIVEPFYFTDEDAYNRFLSIIPTLKITAIHDDQFSDYDIVFIQEGTGDFIFTLEINNATDYQRIKTKIECFGWQLCRSTELS